MALPEWLAPMAATLTADRFAGPEWTFERKLDGIRVLAYKRGPTVQLWSRNRLSLTDAYPAVTRALAALPVRDAIFDGEATGAWGRQGRADYHVFDVLWFEGRSVTAEPLEARRALLGRGALCAAGGPGHAAARRQALGARLPFGLGGRDRQAPRLALRAPPIEALAEDEVRGLAGAGRRRLHRSAGRPRRLRRAAGRLLRGIGPRVRRQDRHWLRHRAAAHAAGPARSACRRRLRRSPRAPACRKLRVHWVRPEIVVQVAFTEWTPYDKLRHPRLLGLREDKAAADVVRERP